MVTGSFISEQINKQERLYILKEIRQKYGEQYYLVQYEDRIEHISVKDDPLAAVREAAGELQEPSIEDIQEDIEAEAKADAQDTDINR